MPDPRARHYRFGPFHADMQTRELRRASAPVVLTAKAFEVLRVLLENRDRVVGRDELMAAVWARRVVEENNLTQAVAALRRAFGTAAGDHAYILTVPGRGYRFVADVEEVETEDAGAGLVLPAREAPAPPVRFRHPGVFVLPALAVVLALALLAAAPGGWNRPGTPALAESRPSPCAGADPEAYRAYIAGIYQGERPSGARSRQAVELFQRAIERDPACAMAYAGLSQAYRRAVMTGDEDPRRNFPLARAAAERALKIDPALADAHAAKGFIQFWYDWDWPGAEASLRRAVALDPRLPEAELAYAHLLASLARHAEAAAHVRRMVELDPLSPLANTLAARFHAAAGRHGEADAALDRALDVEPDFWVARLTRGSWRMRADAEAGLLDLRYARNACDDCSQALSALGEALVASGREGEARQLLHLMQARRRDGYFPATAVAAVHNALGETDAALAMLERGHEERDVGMTFLRMERRWHNLRDDPRFQEFERRMGFARSPVIAAEPAAPESLEALK